MDWDIVIGIETHVQLRTKSKQFSGASIKYGSEPNSQACLISLAYPGVLPVLPALSLALFAAVSAFLSASSNFGGSGAGCTGGIGGIAGIFGFINPIIILRVLNLSLIHI